MIYPAIKLKSNKDYIAGKGHPWIFSGALQRNTLQIEPGSLVQLQTSLGQPVGLGFYHPNTNLAFRFVTREPDQTIDRDFWMARLKQAFDLRKRLFDEETDAFRLINSEGDGFPGLIADVYGRVLVLSIQTAGMEKMKDLLLDCLTTIGTFDAIYERSTGSSRKQEGLENRETWLWGKAWEESVSIKENGLTFQVDVTHGQKTGFFLDQRDNRQLVEKLCSGLDVLNCFSYTGGFSVYAARGGAAKVVSVDISKQACEMAAKTLELNGYSSTDHPVIAEDVFQFLRHHDKSYDLIILDPPAFTKTVHDVKRAARGYKDINLQAAHLLKPGGLLITFSCSHYIDDALFEKIVLGAMEDAHCSMQQLKQLGPGPDHPVLLGHAEGHYLKGLLLKRM